MRATRRAVQRDNARRTTTALDAIGELRAATTDVAAYAAYETEIARWHADWRWHLIWAALKQREDRDE